MKTVYDSSGSATNILDFKELLVVLTKYTGFPFSVNKSTSIIEIQFGKHRWTGNIRPEYSATVLEEIVRHQFYSDSTVIQGTRRKLKEHLFTKRHSYHEGRSYVKLSASLFSGALTIQSVHAASTHLSTLQADTSDTIMLSSMMQHLNDMYNAAIVRMETKALGLLLGIAESAVLEMASNSLPDSEVASLAPAPIAPRRAKITGKYK